MVVHEVLPESPLLCETRRVTPPRRPFLFNPDQARRLLEVAEQLPSNPRAQTRGETYKMIFALLYGLGLRVGEVSRLCRKDIDLDNQLLTIRQTKFGKDRLVPFGPKMARAINGFLNREEARFGPLPPESPTFSFSFNDLLVEVNGVKQVILREEDSPCGRMAAVLALARNSPPPDAATVPEPASCRQVAVRREVRPASGRVLPASLVPVTSIVRSCPTPRRYAR